MSTIRATCPECGDVELNNGLVTAIPTEEDGSGFYSFPCHGVDVIKPAESRTIDLLLAAGCAEFLISNFGLILDPVQAEGGLTESDIDNFIIDLHYTDTPQEVLPKHEELLQ